MSQSQSQMVAPKLNPDDLRDVGFIPGYTRFDAGECQYLNEQLFIILQTVKYRSPEWYQKAKDFHQHAKSILRCCG